MRRKIFFLFCLCMTVFFSCGTPEEMSVSRVPSSQAEVTASIIPSLQAEVTASIIPSSQPEATATVTPSPQPTVLPDTVAPVLNLLGDSTMQVIARKTYVEPGYLAVDNEDGDISEHVEVSGEVDVNWCGTYMLQYKVTDSAGNMASTERIVEVVQPKVAEPEEKVIYLTFDDGPGKYTQDVLDILAKYQLQATFFTCVNGRMDLVKQTYEAGHTIAIHCKNHDYNVVYASEEAYFEDLFAMEDLIYEAIGIYPTMIRFPGGSSNKVSSYNPGIMTRLTEQVEQMGFQYFDWNVSSGDSGTKDTKKILDNLINGVKNKKYAVVLQHPETRKFSMEALEEFIIWGLENGYTFLPLDETSPRAHHSVNN